MYRVSFHPTWGESDQNFFKSIVKQTTNKSGKWRKIQGVVDADTAEYHVVFNNPRMDVNTSKTLLFSAEPPVSSMYKNWNKIKAAKKFPIESYYFPQLWWVERSYDELIEMDPPPKSRELSWITSDKGKNVGSLTKLFRKFVHKAGWKEEDRKGLPLVGPEPTDGHILRMAFYERLVSRYPQLLDLYGRGQFSGVHYRGEVDDKWEGLSEYKYTLAIENYKGPNYFSEKITDALLAWCMPIYWGCTNLGEYIPEDSYIWIDIESPDAPKRVHEIVNSNLRQKNLDAIAEARRRILNRYQIWPTVDRAVKICEGE